MATDQTTGTPRPKRVSPNRTHGCSRWSGNETPEYRTWCYIITRCYNPKAKCYRYYGARGIRMCDRWRNSFVAFLEDVGPRPSDKHSIDRIDTNGHYEPGNVRWATKRQQMRNTTRNRLLTAGGRTQCTAAWAEETGLPAKVIEARLKLGWPEERAVMTPKQVPMTEEQRRERRREYERKRSADPERKRKQREYEAAARARKAR